MYGEVFVSTISLVYLLLKAFLKLVAKIVKLYVSGLPIVSSPDHTPRLLHNFEQSPCYCKMEQRQRADLSV